MRDKSSVEVTCHRLRGVTLPELPPATVHVILPSYNRRRYLDQSLQSILSQTYQDLHVLVIDDCSTDGTRQLAQGYQERMPHRISVVAKPARRGVADSINLGLTLTKSAEFVAIQNDDDIWMPEKLRKQIATFRALPELGFVATEADIIDAAGRPTGQRFSDILGRPDTESPARQIFLEGNRYCNASVVATRAACDLTHPYFPRDGGCGDMYMWLVISAHMPVKWLAEPLTQYRIASGQLTSVRSRQMWRETYSLRERLLQDPHVRAAIGGEDVGRERLDDNALFLARSYLRSGDLTSYAWFSWRILKRRRLRLLALLARYTVSSLTEGAGDLFWARLRRRRVTSRSSADRAHD